MHIQEVVATIYHNLGIDPKKTTLTDRGIDDSIRGKANIVAGRVQDAVGALTGDAKMQFKGKVRTAKGKVQNAAGKLEVKLDRDS